MPGATYRPRAWAVLTVPISGNAAKRNDDDYTDDPISFPVRVRKAVLEQNDHNHADTLHVTLEWSDAGVDPRLLSSATIEFYLGDATNADPVNPFGPNLRFVGIAINVKRMAKDDEGFVVEMEFHDYTAIFLECKPFVTKGVPALSQTLDDAWRKICDFTGYSTGDGNVQSSVSALRERLVLQGGLTAFPALSSACAPRFAKLGKVSIKQGCDAWAVWQQCCGMLGLITFVKLDQVVVTTATDYYTAKNPPRLIWGKNIVSWTETRKAMMFAKGVGVTSFNPLTGTTIEALYPAPGDPAITHKRLTAKKKADPEAVRHASDYEYFAVPEITDPAAAYNCAKRIYEERSRQEMEGTLETVEMSVATKDGSLLDLLTLSAGEVISVELGTTLGELDVPARGSGGSTVGTISDRVTALVRKGYSQGAAQVIAANLDDLSRLDTTFFVKTVRTTCQFDNDEGDFKIEINYVNRIKVSGEAEPE